MIVELKKVKTNEYKINSESMKDEDKKESIGKRFLSTATIHGAAKIYEANKLHTYVLWILILTTLTSTFAYFIGMDFDEYFKYDVDVTTTYVDNRGTMEFPAVTFCNANRVSLKKFEALFKVNKSSLIIDYCNKLSQSDFYLNKSLLSSLASDDKFFIPSTCRFNNLQCNFTLFKKFHTIHYGMCYTFNFYGNNKQALPGQEIGLSLSININQHDYFPCDFYYAPRPAGAVVMLHEPGNSLDYKSPIKASPGAITHIEIQKALTERLEFPYVDDCRKYGDSNADEYPILTNSRYTIKDCFYTCYIVKLNETCKEVDFEGALSAREYGHFFEYTSRPTSCILNFREKFTKGEIDCKCRVECEEKGYLYVIMPNAWPPKVALQNWKEALNIINNSTTSTESDVNENIVGINLFYNRFSIFKTVHTPKYTFGSLLSDIGGFSGLFIGASVFSVIEIFIFLLCWFFNKLSKTYKKSSF